MPDGRTLSLQTLRVQSPCPMRWDELDGDSRSRYCAHCGLHVHNLSTMTRDEAQKLICTAAGRLCVAYVPSARGTATTLEYYRQRPPKHRWRFVVVLAGVCAVGSAAASAVLHPWRKISPPAPPPIVVGAIALPPPTVMGDVQGAPSDLPAPPSQCE